MRKKILIGSGTFLVVVVVALVILSAVKKEPSSQETQQPVEKPVIHYRYGIAVDSFEIEEGRVGRNQFIGKILNDHGVSPQKIFMLSQLPRDSFDVRRVKAGNNYALFKDSTGVRYLVYEKDKLEYVVVGFDSLLTVRTGRKPMEIVTHEISGRIVSSLWETFINMGENPLLANELSDIYQWSIDFFGLQEGDQFRVIYDEGYVDEKSYGITMVYAAWFYHANHEFWAIPFTQDGERSFFDEEGNSLRKTFLKAPLSYSRISSGYSNSRMHPVLKIRRPHHGIDYAAPTGTPVHTVGDGQVIAAGWDKKGGGNYIKVKHNGVYTTTYMHLSGFARGIKKGVYVKQGDVIGYVGSTGLATGPHLDFRYTKNGYAINPLRVEAPPVEPIKEENRLDYEVAVRSWMDALKRIKLPPEDQELQN